MAMSKGKKIILVFAFFLCVTIVLAAVMYVMVIGFCGCGTQTPAGIIKEIDEVQPGIEKVVFSQFNPNTKWEDIRFYIGDNSSYYISSGFNIKHDTGILSGIPMGVQNITNLSVFGKDLQKNDTVDNGDYLVIYGLNKPGTYRVGIIYLITGSLICEKVFTR
jgi:hypothetical protein